MTSGEEPIEVSDDDQAVRLFVMALLSLARDLSESAPAAPASEADDV